MSNEGGRERAAKFRREEWPSNHYQYPYMESFVCIVCGQLFNFIQEYAQKEKELPSNYRTRTSATAANASPRIGGSRRTSVSPKRTRYGKFLDMHCELVENTWLTFLFRNKLQQFG
jgi:hypothetical protein